MGLFDRFRFLSSTAESISDPQNTMNFVIDQGSIDPALFGLPAYPKNFAPEGRISRREAIQLGAVKSARDKIASVLGTLPLYSMAPDNTRTTNSLLEQPEADIPRSITINRTIEDLIFEGVAWWRVAERGWHGYPTRVVRLDPTTVDVRRDNKVYVRHDGSVQGTVWEFVPDADLIRFDSPNDPLLVAGAAAIRNALRLEFAARNLADEPQPMAYITPKDGADPTQEQITQFLDAWRLARQSRVTAWLPEWAEYREVTGWNPSQMQLVEARQHAVLEIARIVGMDPADLGVPVTSDTYKNAVDRRLALQDLVFGPYAVAFTDRLSMGDVTPRGYKVRFDFNAFTRSDEGSRMDTYAKALAVGAYGVEEIQRREELPAFNKQEQPVAESQITQSDLPPSITFAKDSESITFEFDTTSENFTIDPEARTITGLAVPYGEVAEKGGRKFRFNKGSLKFSDAQKNRLLIQHDYAHAVGFLIKAQETDKGMIATYRVARGVFGDDALARAQDGVLDGMSVGVDFTPDGVRLNKDGVIDVISSRWRETSLTPNQAFSGAQVLSVTATSDEGELTMPDATTEPQAPAAPAAATAVDFSGLTDAVKTGIAEAFAQAPQVISAAAGTRYLQVEEALPYRFDGGVAEHCFSRDLISHLGRNDGEAGLRLDKFMSEMNFNVTTGNVSTLNPSINRPDLYVDQLEFLYPFWTATQKGTLTSNTPQVLPKFSSSGTLVADHVEGVEPAGAGALATTSQTITPTPLSGKTVVNREVWDQGGNPMLDTILWRQIVRAYYEGLESYIVAQLAALSASITDITITTAAADAALEASLTSQLATLQYVRGGNQFRDFIVQVDLYKALIAAKDGNGRKLFPILSPQNATGTTDPFFADVMVGGLRARPGWALAATGSVAASSWLFNREFVHTWASAPQKFTMDQIKVATVEIGVWGYKAFAVTDVNGVREVIYDPV